MVMKKITVIGAVVIMLVLAHWAQGGVSMVRNGSFEDDGGIYPLSEENAPNAWDVNVPSGKFGGWVDTDWPICGSYNLTLYSYKSGTFDMNDMATVSQQVYLADVNVISFDIRLDTDGGDWDPNKRTAVLLIDDKVVWESNSVGTDVRDEYYNRTVDVDIDDTGWHTLSLGLRVDVNENGIKYYTDWDCVEFSLHCGGFGFLAGDFSRDCYVDINDLGMLTEVWLDEVDPHVKYNLFRGDDAYGVINFFDFAVFANSWDGDMPDLKMLTEVWLDEVAKNHEYNLFKGDDVDAWGVINFLDFAIFADNWMRNSYE